MICRSIALLFVCLVVLGCRRDSAATIDLAAPVWSVDGVVVDANRAPIPGAYLELRWAKHPKAPSFLMARIASGADGRFYFATPITGAFTIDLVGLSPCGKSVDLGAMKDQDRKVEIVVEPEDCRAVY